MLFIHSPKSKKKLYKNCRFDQLMNGNLKFDGVIKFNDLVDTHLPVTLLNFTTVFRIKLDL